MIGLFKNYLYLNLLLISLEFKIVILQFDHHLQQYFLLLHWSDNHHHLHHDIVNIWSSSSHSRINIQWSYLSVFHQLDNKTLCCISIFVCVNVHQNLGKVHYMLTRKRKVKLSITVRRFEPCFQYISLFIPGILISTLWPTHEWPGAQSQLWLLIQAYNIWFVVTCSQKFSLIYYFIPFWWSGWLLLKITFHRLYHWSWNTKHWDETTDHLFLCGCPNHLVSQ